MRYVCLIYGDERAWDRLSETDVEELERRRAAHDDALRQSGRYLGGECLHPAHTATTVTVRDQRVSILDGPFLEGTEALAGFYVIDARDLNDAIRTASAIPLARMGAVEVRPVRWEGFS